MMGKLGYLINEFHIKYTDYLLGDYSTEDSLARIENLHKEYLFKVTTEVDMLRFKCKTLQGLGYLDVVNDMKLELYHGYKFISEMREYLLEE